MNLSIKNNYLEASFRLKGGELESLKCNGKEFMMKNEKYWDYTSPILFPIIGKLKDSFTMIENKRYEIPKHGIIRASIFTVKEKKDDEISFSFISNKETLVYYPFNFEMIINHKLIEKKIVTNITIYNLDDKEMYFNLGLHPAFLLEKDFSKYKIVFEELENNLIPSVENNGTINFENGQKEYKNLQTLPLDYKDYVTDALIFRGCNSNSVKLLDDENKGIKFDFHDFSTLALWTTNKTNAPFICIEPWIGYASKHNDNNNFLDKDYLIKLEKRTNLTVDYSFEIIDF